MTESTERLKRAQAFYPQPRIGIDNWQEPTFI